MKVVINCTYGTFALAINELEYYYRLKGIKEFFYYAQCREQEGYYKKVNKAAY